jgi:hypothetical protein
MAKPPLTRPSDVAVLFPVIIKFDHERHPTFGFLRDSSITQEVAYNSILEERRKQIHEQAAQAIEALFAANLPDHYADLARHYVRSDSTPKAIDYLHLVAQQATIYDSESMRRFARVELGLEELPPLTLIMLRGRAVFEVAYQSVVGRHWRLQRFPRPVPPPQAQLLTHVLIGSDLRTFTLDI